MGILLRHSRSLTSKNLPDSKQVDYPAGSARMLATCAKCSLRAVHGPIEYVRRARHFAMAYGAVRERAQLDRGWSLR